MAPARWTRSIASSPGLNSGWIDLMGPDSLDPQDTSGLFNMPGAGITYSDPEFSWVTTVAPTAILFPDGSSLGASYDDVALVSDNNNGNIYALPLNAGRTGFTLPGDLADLVANDQEEADTLIFGSGFGPITDLERGPDGHIYAVDIGNGTVYRISGGPTGDADADGVPDATRQLPDGRERRPGRRWRRRSRDACRRRRRRLRQLRERQQPARGRGLPDHQSVGHAHRRPARRRPRRLRQQVRRQVHRRTVRCVGGLDLGQFRTSSGEDRRFDTCGTVGGSRPCAIFDLDEAATGNAIGGLDLGRFRQLSGATPGPRCAACTGTGSRAASVHGGNCGRLHALGRPRPTARVKGRATRVAYAVRFCAAAFSTAKAIASKSSR